MQALDQLPTTASQGVPFRARRRIRRRLARERCIARTTRPLRPEQRAPEPPRYSSSAARLFGLAAFVVGSAVTHAGIVLVAIVIGALKLGVKAAEHEVVSIEVQEREREKPREPEPAALAEPVAPKPSPIPAKAKVAPAETPETPAAPMRVVGISLESTVEGGEGPGFAVGDTRVGQTDSKAASAKKAGNATAAPSAPATTTPNRVASGIPTVGVKTELPKRKRPRLPAYPPDLKSQGIEADVTVMVTLDETGKVTSVKIISPAPQAAFNQAAQTAAQSEAFEPARKNGVAVPYTLSFTYRFRIQQ